MVVAPHHLASQAGLRVLQEGGNAIEAIVAAASTISVVYPHMNSLGGDNFWLISDGGIPIGIDACGAVASSVDRDFYKDKGFSSIPSRGPLAANTVAGTVSGWHNALDISSEWGGALPVSRLLEDAVYYAYNGFPVTVAQHVNTAQKLRELKDIPGFAETFLVAGSVPPVGMIFKNPRLGDTLEKLGKIGLDTFYRGELAKALAADLVRVGCPITIDDLMDHRSIRVTPLEITLAPGTIYNMPPPTQGLASLMILAIFEQLNCPSAESFEFIHGMVEATKKAFQVRDEHVTDPAYMDVDPNEFLEQGIISSMASTINMSKASASDANSNAGDTVWLGAIDDQGRSVSFIQSIYWEFGSGVVLQDSGVVWQNRGTFLSLDAAARNTITPRRKPFHTIQPALARLNDGRIIVYGTMGGEGQPQTQAAIFARHVMFGQALQAAVTAPRWLLGRTWGAPKSNLRIENRFNPTVINALTEAGHDLELVAPFDDIMGHAGAIVRDQTGLLMGAADPRCDGVVAAF